MTGIGMIATVSFISEIALCQTLPLCFKVLCKQYSSEAKTAISCLYVKRLQPEVEGFA